MKYLIKSWGLNEVRAFLERAPLEGAILEGVEIERAQKEES